MKLTTRKLKEMIKEELTKLSEQPEKQFAGNLKVTNTGISGKLGLEGKQLHDVNIKVSEIPRSELQGVKQLDRYAIARTLLPYFGKINKRHPFSYDYTYYGRGVNTLKNVKITKGM